MLGKNEYRWVPFPTERGAIGAGISPGEGRDKVFIGSAWCVASEGNATEFRNAVVEHTHTLGQGNGSVDRGKKNGDLIVRPEIERVGWAEGMAEEANDLTLDPFVIAAETDADNCRSDTGFV